MKDEKQKCNNFEKCGNYTNAKHSKWCSPCSFTWQIRQSGYEPEFEIKDGEIYGLVLTRKDIFEKHKKKTT